MGVIGEALGTAGVTLPQVSMSGVSSAVAIFLGALMFTGLLGLGTWYFYNELRFKQRVILFKKVGKSILPVFKDKAILERLGSAGDTWFRLKKCKKILPRPTIQMGKNLYWFYEREDGEWINIGMSDIDEKMREAHVYYVDEDMRLQRLGIQKNLQERLQKLNFWQKYGTMIMNLIFLMVIMIVLIVLFNKMEGLWGQMTSTAEAIEHMAESVTNMATRQGSGVVPV